jgi:hypothetical protein
MSKESRTPRPSPAAMAEPVNDAMLEGVVRLGRVESLLAIVQNLAIWAPYRPYVSRSDFCHSHVINSRFTNSTMVYGPPAVCRDRFSSLNRIPF